MGVKTEQKSVFDRHTGNSSDIFNLLGRENDIQPPVTAQCEARELCFDEVDEYLDFQNHNSFRIALGIMLCIDCPVVPVLVDGFDMAGLIPSGVAELFEGLSMVAFVAIAVILFIYSAIRSGRWDYLREEKCHIEEPILNYIRKERILSKRINVNLTIAGVILIFSSFIPRRIFMTISADIRFMDNLSFALILILISIGVFLISMVVLRMNFITGIIRTNIRLPHSRQSQPVSEEEQQYNNPVIAKGMSVFWPTTLCFYISLSFLTFAWEISWVIFPAAWIIYEIIGRVFRGREAA